MSDWNEKLKRGAIRCRVLHGDELIVDFTPTSVDQLWAPILIHDLGETAEGDFVLEYRQFAESGKLAACFEGEACSTIEKFGKAIQFKETFLVEFEAAGITGSVALTTKE
jgi:hypothetical protein